MIGFVTVGDLDCIARRVKYGIACSSPYFHAINGPGSFH
jgi:hypothetical protein